MEPSIGNYNLNRQANPIGDNPFLQRMFDPNRQRPTASDAMNSMPYSEAVKQAAIFTLMGPAFGIKTTGAEDIASKVSSEIQAGTVSNTMGSSGGNIGELIYKALSKRKIPTTSNPEILPPQTVFPKTNAKIPKEITNAYKEVFKGEIPITEPVSEFHVGGKVLVPQPLENMQSVHGSALHTTPDLGLIIKVLRGRGSEGKVVNEFLPFKGQNHLKVSSSEDILKLADKLGFTEQEKQWAVQRAQHELQKAGMPLTDPRPILKSIRDLSFLKVTGIPTKYTKPFDRGLVWGDELRRIGVNRFEKPAADHYTEIINLNEGGAGNVINRDVLNELIRQMRSR